MEGSYQWVSLHFVIEVDIQLALAIRRRDILPGPQPGLTVWKEQCTPYCNKKPAARLDSSYSLLMSLDHSFVHQAISSLHPNTIEQFPLFDLIIFYLHTRQPPYHFPAHHDSKASSRAQGRCPVCTVLRSHKASTSWSKAKAKLAVTQMVRAVPAHPVFSSLSSTVGATTQHLRALDSYQVHHCHLHLATLLL